MSFNPGQLSRALQNQALPALERLAEHEVLRDRAVARFDREEPPPYLSSTDEEEDPGLDLSPEAVDRLLDEPLNDQERKRVLVMVGLHSKYYKPGDQFAAEVEQERDRVTDWADFEASPATRDHFIQLGLAHKGRAGRERVNIIARRNVKRRWQKLGVWNDDWGIPDRADPRPNDDTSAWKWPWQHGDAAAEWTLGPEQIPNENHPVRTALRARQDLRRGERGPIPAYSHLGPDATASQAEPFITSRPWFMMGVERAEEHLRKDRLHWRRKRQQYKGSMFDNVRRFWEARGDWKEEWHDERADKTAIGWKWPRESPSPEPEDLAGLEDMASFELTPSEADALESVRPPSPPTPRLPYNPPPGGYRPLFGGAPSGPLPGVEDLEPPEEADAEPQPLRRSARIAASAGKRDESPLTWASGVSKPGMRTKQEARPKPAARSSGQPDGKKKKPEKKKEVKSTKKTKASGKRG